MEPRWICVTEALPPKGEPVIATDGMVTGEVVVDAAGRWRRYNGRKWDWLPGVRYWMPMPEPPMGEVRH